MSEWDRMLGEAALGRDLIPLDQVRCESAQRSPGLMLIDQPSVRPVRLTSTSPEAIFRLEALQFRTRGRDALGGVVRLGSRWIRWAYRATLVLVLAAVASMWFIHTGETTAGPAVLDGPSGAITALLPAVVAPDLADSQGLTLALPDGRSVRVVGLRVQLADAAAIRAAGLAPLSQPAIMVTGRLVPRSAPAQAERELPSRTEVTVVLRSESLADVLARQFRAILGQGNRAVSRKVPVIRQLEDAECGAACLAMVLGYFGNRADLRELRDLTGAGRDGVSALSLVRAARACGLRARGVQADLGDLRHLPRGSVLHWEFNHFVVFERTTRAGIRIVDPAHGRRIVSRDDLRRAYTGVAILLEPSETFDGSSSRAKGTWRYLRPMLGQSGNMVRVIATSLVIRLAALGLPLLTALVVDEIVPRDDHRLLLVFTAGVAVVIGYTFLSSFLRANVLVELRTRLDAGLTLSFVDHLVKLPYDFFLRRSSGDLMMRLQSNTAVRDILATGTLSAVLDGAFASLYLILLFIISPVLAVVVLLLALGQVATLLLSWRRNQRLMSGSLQAQADTQSYAYEMLAGIETLKASGAEHRAADHWGDLFTDQVNIDLTRGRLTAAVGSVMGTLRVAAPLVILLVGTFQVLGGHLSLGTMLSASALGAGFLDPLASLVASGLQLQQLPSYMHRINDVLDTPREQHGRRLHPAPRLSGRIRAENVSFRYGAAGSAVVSQVSLEIQPGQHVGIVGRSGSGKSTLAHLLLGLYQPTSGRIEFDGQDLTVLDAGSVRRQVGIVTQRPYLFGASIRENIALTDPELPLQAIIAAARIACVHDDIATMPMGYDTKLHGGGASISGGQSQRIALARALVHQPSIVLLDEATSELDTVTERQIYRNLEALSATTIVIAHRLSTVRSADLILVMEQGQVVEAGTHEQLLVRQGAYTALVHAQSAGGESAAGGLVPLWAHTPTA